MIKFKFIPEGTKVQKSKDLLIIPHHQQTKIGDIFICDVGGLLDYGVIDHHTTKKQNECATTLVYKNQDKYVRDIMNKERDDFTIITHSGPDFDAIGCTYVVGKILKNEPIPDQFDEISNYILEVDLGRIQLDENNLITPFSLVLSINHIINIKYSEIISKAKLSERAEIIENKNREILKRSFEVVDFLLSQLKLGKSLFDKDLFANIEGFNDEIQLLQQDLEKYKHDYERSKKFVIPILNKINNENEEVDLIITEYPKSILWKYWTRGDRKNSSFGNGFVFTCAFLDTFERDFKSRAIIAVDRTTDFYLNGLGIALDQAEVKKIISTENITHSPESFREKFGTNPEKKRNGYPRENPWYDEREEFTIIDAPKGGSVLKNNEIVDIIISPYYWISLGKNTGEQNYYDNNFKEFLQKFYTPGDDSREKEQLAAQINVFVDNLKSGLNIDAEKNLVLDSIFLLLDKTDPEINESGIEYLSMLIKSISQIPLKKHLIKESVANLRYVIVERLIKNLNHSGLEKDIKFQGRIFTILKKYFSPGELRDTFGKYLIVNYNEFINIFYYACKKCSKDDFFRNCIKLLEKQSDKILFTSLSEEIEKSYNSGNIEDNEKKEYDSIIKICTDIQKYLNDLNYSNYSLPLSSYDDFKDSIDDLFMFSAKDRNLKEKTRSFIKKDWEYFIEKSHPLEEHDLMNKEYIALRDSLILDQDYWKKFILYKNEVEVLFQKNTEFNPLRKYTETFLKTCRLSEFTVFVMLLRKAKAYKPDNFPGELNLMLDKLFLFKTFENLLNRIKIILINSEIQFINSFDGRLESYSERINSKTYKIESILDILRRILNILIKAQYLPDASVYQLELQLLLQKFSIVLPKCSELGYNNENISTFYKLCSLFEKIYSKNNIPITEYDKKINAISKIISIIGSESSGLMQEVKISLMEPEKSSVYEILFTLRKHLEDEIHFYIHRIKANLENDTRETRINLKSIFGEIICEATHDELRKQKQIVDIFADVDFQDEFYNEVIKKYRFFLYNKSNKNRTNIVKKEKSEKNINQFSKQVRAYFLDQREIFDKNLLRKQIKFFKKEKNKKIFGDPKLSIEDIIVFSQLNPQDVSRLPESVNIEVYQYLISLFLNRFLIDDAKKQIEDYWITKFPRSLKIMTSWWLPLFALFSICSTFVFSSGSKDTISILTGLILTIITFAPIVFIVLFLSKVLINHYRRKRLSNRKGVLIYLFQFGFNKILNFSRNLLFIDFLVPLVFGIMLVFQDNNLLKGILKLEDYRLISILILLISLSYYALINTVHNKNSFLSLFEANKIAVKIYAYLLSQSWFITTTILNLFAIYFIELNDLNNIIEMERLSAKVVEFSLYGLQLKYVIFPIGTMTITFISLFIGLFVESFISGIKRVK